MTDGLLVHVVSKCNAGRVRKAEGREPPGIGREKAAGTASEARLEGGVMPGGRSGKASGGGVTSFLLGPDRAAQARSESRACVPLP